MCDADTNSEFQLVLAVELGCCIADAENTGHWDDFARAFHERFDGNWAGRLEVQINPMPSTFGKEVFMPLKQADKWLKGSRLSKEAAAVHSGAKVVDVSEGTPQLMKRSQQGEDVVLGNDAKNGTTLQMRSCQYVLGMA